MNKLAVFSMSLLPALIQFAEQIHGPKSGPSKLSTVVQLAQAALANLAAFGFIPVGVAHDILGITVMTNAKVAEMKASGDLPTSNAMPAMGVDEGAFSQNDPPPNGDQETTPIVDAPQAAALKAK